MECVSARMSLITGGVRAGRSVSKAGVISLPIHVLCRARRQSREPYQGHLLIRGPGARPPPGTLGGVQECGVRGGSRIVAMEELARRMRRPVLSMLLDVASALHYDWLLMINRPQRASARVRQPVHRLLASHDRTIDRKVAQSLCHLGESGPERGEAAYAQIGVVRHHHPQDHR